MSGIKAVGAVLVLCCVLLWGVSRIIHERAQRACAESFLALLRHVRVQIDCFSMPVSEILASADKDLLAACGAEDVSPADFGALLATGERELAPEVYATLAAFEKELGTRLRDEQLRLCDRSIAKLTSLCEAARNEAPRREKLLLLLPPALAGIVILLLL